MPDPKYVRSDDPDSCYNRAGPGEPLFTFLGRDRHAAALVELWAFLREKEDEAAAVVANAREAAAEMRTYATALGRPSLSLDTLLSLSASLVEARRTAREAERDAALAGPPIAEGDAVVSRAPVPPGTVLSIGIVRKIFPSDATPESLRGQMNVEIGGRMVTAAVASYRLATPADR